MPIFFYLTIQGGWIKAIKELPWVGGICIGILLPSLWYVAAEIRTPGFIEYFVLGEHIYRFIKPGWAGDLYGFAHAQPKGMIWLYALLALMPWSIFLMLGFIKKPIKSLQSLRNNPLRAFLLCWALSHLIFFSLPANIIWPYYLPMAPAFAILFADLIGDKNILSKWLIYISTALMTLALLAGFYFVGFSSGIHIKSGKQMIQVWKNEQSDQSSQLHYFSNKRLFSLEFYSLGRATQIKSEEAIQAIINNESVDYLLINKDDLEKLPTNLLQHFTPINADDNSALHLILLKEIH